MTDSELQVSTRARLYVLTISIAGLTILGFSIKFAIASPSHYWLFLLLLTILASLFPVRVPFVRRRREALMVTVNDVFTYTAILFFSPATAVVIAAAEGLLISKRRVSSQPLSKIVFNVAQNSLSCFIAGTFFYWLQDALPPLDPARIGPDQTIPFLTNLVGCAALYFVVNTGIVALAVSMTTGLDVTKLWRESFLWTAATNAAAATTAGLIFLNVQNTPSLVVVIVIPIVIVIYAAFQTHLSKISQAEQHLHELDELFHSTITSLAMAIDAKDQSTHGHVQRVQALVLGLARKMGIEDDAELKGLRAAALLHDIGKLAVPEYILNKPGRLNEAEMRQMRAHPVVGADILETVPFPYPVTPYVRYHHERWDGKGYPDGLTAEEIPMGARILSIVDCYDALRSDRPYRPKLPRDVALNYIQQEAGKAYDPDIVEVMVANIDELETETDKADREVPKSVLQRIESTFTGPSRPTSIVPAPTPVPDRNAELRSTVFHDIASTHKAVQAVYEISRNIGKSLSVSDTLELLASRIMELVPYSACSIYLINSTDEHVVPHHVTGVHAEQLRRIEINRGEGITGWVAANNKPLLNLSPDPEFLKIEELQKVFQSCLSVPLSIDRDVVGVITLYCNQDDAYSSEHLQLMETVAPHAASAINNAIIHEETREDAYTDLLTGLPNLRYFYTFINDELRRAERLCYSVTVLMMDLERFKEVNDRLGHKMGDAVLVKFGRLLKEQLRRSDICLRYGGDEFVGVLPGIGKDLAHETITRIQQAVEATSFVLADEDISLGVSVGSATFPEDTRDPNQLLALADQAMYHNKVLRSQTGEGSAVVAFQKRKSETN